jgi:hypothetical protein
VVSRCGRPDARLARLPEHCEVSGVAAVPRLTLGPTLIAVALLENAKGRTARWLRMFGEVPFFHYLLHIPIIHLVAVAISLVRTPESTGLAGRQSPAAAADVPPGYEWSLWLLYAVTAAVVVALYFPCRWFARVKRRSSRPWVRFL